MFSAIKKYEKYDKLPKVWDDFLKLNGTSVNIMVSALRIMESGVDELAGLDVLNIPTYIWENTKNEEHRIRFIFCVNEPRLNFPVNNYNFCFRWNSEFVSLLLRVFCYYKDFEKACDVFDTVGKSALAFEMDSVYIFTDYCLSMKNKDKALVCDLLFWILCMSAENAKEQ